MESTDSDDVEVKQRVRGFTEAQRLEYFRRLTVCDAVLNLAGPLTIELTESQANVKEQSRMASRKWVIVTLIVGIALTWLGRELDLTFLTNIGYLLGIVLLLAVAQSALAEKEARRLVSDANLRMHTLRFHWLSSGVSGSTLDTFCNKVREAGDSQISHAYREARPDVRYDVARGIAMAGQSD